MTEDTRTNGHIGRYSVAVVSGPEDDRLDWLAVDCQHPEDNVRRLRQRIFAVSQAGGLKKVRSLGSTPGNRGLVRSRSATPPLAYERFPFQWPRSARRCDRTRPRALPLDCIGLDLQVACRTFRWAPLHTSSCRGYFVPGSPHTANCKETVHEHTNLRERLPDCLPISKP